jgi:hypothetical protein
MEFSLVLAVSGLSRTLLELIPHKTLLPTVSPILHGNVA